jgi:hypothetical protein
MLELKEQPKILVVEVPGVLRRGRALVGEPVWLERRGEQRHQLRPCALRRACDTTMTITLARPMSSRDAPDRSALEREGLAVAVVVVTRGAAEADHRVVFAPLEAGGVEERSALLGLEVRRLA